MPSLHLCFLLGTSSSSVPFSHPSDLRPMPLPTMGMCSLIFPSDSAPSLKEEETYKAGSLADDGPSDTVGSASPVEPSQDEKRY